MTGKDPAPLIAPDRAHRGLQEGRLAVVDIRERHEQLTGMAEGALSLGGRNLPEVLDELLAGDSHLEAVALICERGNRSAQACLEHGGRYSVPLLDVAGGMQAWIGGDLPVELPQSRLSGPERTRYLRHLALAEVGEVGQVRLGEARVLIVGAGGLGSPCAMYLAAAGVGQLAIVDDDRVELSNLQRQLLHGESQVGSLKVDSARQRLAGINGDIRIETHACRVSRENIDDLVEGYSLVIDGSDNFPTRYLLNDACTRRGKTLVYGAVERFTGQVGVFQPGDGRQPCYRCLFPRPPAPADAPSCAEAGVLGVLPGVIGTLQATEALKLVLGIGTPLTGQVLHYDALSSAFRRTRVIRDPACRWCDPAHPVDCYPDYREFCSAT